MEVEHLLPGCDIDTQPQDEDEGAMFFELMADNPNNWDYGSD